MSKQPDALRLADELDAESISGRVSNYTGRKAATELRCLNAEITRMHSENEALNAKLTPLTPGQCVDIADFAAKLEFSDNFLSDICKIVELVEVAHGIVKP